VNNLENSSWQDNPRNSLDINYLFQQDDNINYYWIEDDIWLPTKVEEMMRMMKTHSNMHVLSSSFIYIDDKNCRLGHTKKYNPHYIIP